MILHAGPQALDPQPVSLKLASVVRFWVQGKDCYELGSYSDLHKSVTLEGLTESPKP